jgi:hypothetical protein
MLKRILLILFLAWPAFGQTTYYFRDTGSGDIDCTPWWDDTVNTSRGSSATSVNLAGSENGGWNDDAFAGETRSGLWDCTIAFTVSAGGGAPNTATITMASKALIVPPAEMATLESATG